VVAGNEIVCAADANGRQDRVVLRITCDRQHIVGREQYGDCTTSEKACHIVDVGLCYAISAADSPQPELCNDLSDYGLRCQVNKAVRKPGIVNASGGAQWCDHCRHEDIDVEDDKHHRAAAQRLRRSSSIASSSSS